MEDSDNEGGGVIEESEDYDVKEGTEDLGGERGDPGLGTQF